MTVSAQNKLDPTKLMGIVNMTPDSFSDGGQYNSVDKALKHIESLINDGADIIDIGAESTRPGSLPVSVDEEIRRLEPLLKQYHTHFSCPISLDTSKVEVAEMGLSYNVSYINDVQGTTNMKMWDFIASQSCQYICMHMQQLPQTMQDNPQYSDVIHDIYSSFEEVIYKSGIPVSRLVLDPGIGFGKTVDQNLILLGHLSKFEPLGCALLIGTSRKSFIGAITGDPPEDRLEGTIASSVVAVLNGASIVRIHDVKSIKRSMLIVDKIRGVA